MLERCEDRSKSISQLHLSPEHQTSPFLVSSHPELLQSWIKQHKLSFDLVLFIYSVLQSVLILN